MCDCKMNPCLTWVTIPFGRIWQVWDNIDLKILSECAWTWELVPKVTHPPLVPRHKLTCECALALEVSRRASLGTNGEPDIRWAENFSHNAQISSLLPTWTASTKRHTVVPRDEFSSSFSRKTAIACKLPHPENPDDIHILATRTSLPRLPYLAVSQAMTVPFG